MAEYKIRKSLNSQVTIPYIPRISKSGYNSRIFKAEKLLVDAYIQDVITTPPQNGAEESMWAQDYYSIVKTGSDQNSYTANRGNIYEPKTNFTWYTLAQTLGENKDTAPVLVSSLGSSIPLPYPDTRYIPSVPVYDQGRFPWCQLTAAFSSIGAQLGLTIDIGKTAKCSALGPCDDKDITLDDLVGPGADYFKKKILDGLREELNADIEFYAITRCFSYSENYLECLERIKRLFEPLFENPMLPMEDFAPSLPGTIVDNIKQAYETHRDRYLRGLLLMTTLFIKQGGTFQMSIECKRCPKHYVSDESGGCEGEDCGCTIPVTIEPILNNDLPSDPTRNMLDLINQGIPVIIKIDSNKLQPGLLPSPGTAPPDYSFPSEPVYKVPKNYFKDTPSNHAVIIIGYERLQPNGPTIVRIQNSQGIPEYFNIELPEGTDMGDMFKPGGITTDHKNDKPGNPSIMGFRVTNPTSVDLEEVCAGCGTPVVSCTPTPTDGSTPTPSLPSTTPTPTTDGSTPTPSMP